MKISEYANCDLKVFEKEATVEASGTNLVYEFPTFNLKDNKLPILIHNGAFQAKEPCINFGWANSLDLKNIDENKLLVELQENLSKITEIYNTRNESRYLSLFKERTTEHLKSFYLTKEELISDNKSVFNGLPYKVESPSSLRYKLVFFGEGKLVSLQAKNQPPSFVLNL